MNESSDDAWLSQPPRRPPAHYSFMNGLPEDHRDIHSVSVQSDGKVLIGGSYRIRKTNVSGGGIGRINADGTTDNTFMDGLSGPDNDVLSLAVQTDGKVLIGGHFMNVNGVSRNHLARLNADGSLDDTFLSAPIKPALARNRGRDAGPGPNNAVDCLAVQSNGKVLIGGRFNSVNYRDCKYFARLNPDGSLDSSFQVVTHADHDWAGETVYSLAVQSDGKVLIGGNFGRCNHTAHRHVARLNADGTLDTSFLKGQEDGTNNYVAKVLLQSDGKVLIGGRFDRINGVACKSIVRLNRNGSLDRGFLNGMAGISDDRNSWINSLAVQADAKVLIGGSFSTVNGVARHNIARLNPDGSLDDSFLRGLSGVNCGVNSIAVQSDGKVLISGGFWEVNGVVRHGFARLNADGSLDAAF